MSSSERIAAAAEHGMSVEEFDDLQAWLRHGRIGTGRGYKAEVERAKRIEADRSNAPVGNSPQSTSALSEDRHG